MAVRQDEVQLRVDFITDESRQLARTLLTTKEYNKEIASSTAKIAQYQRELKKVGDDEAKRAPILAKIANEEKRIADNLGKVAAEGKKVEKLDLNRVAPSQLVERAKQLQQAMRLIPQSAPQFKALQTELSGVNARLREINQTSKGIGAGGVLDFRSVTGFAGRATVAIGAAIAAARTFFSSFKASSQLEQTNIAFETFLGNAKAAKSLVAELRDFEVKTPFEADQVFTAAKAFLAFGFSQEQILPTLEKVGTVAAATGKDFNELALIYGKARAEGRIQNDTLNQLAEAGIPIYEELAKVLKVNESQIRKLAEQGKIGFQDLQTAFGNLTSEGGRFNNLLEKQSESLGGLLSTLTGALKNRLTTFLERPFGLIKDITKGIIGLVSGPQKSLIQQTRELQTAFNSEIEVLRRGNFSQEERAKIIGEINTKYKDYLPNLIDEKASIEDIAKAQTEANRVFEQKVLYIALEEEITKVLKDSKEATQLALEAERERVKNLQRDRSREVQDVGRYSEVLERSSAALENLRDASIDVVKDTPEKVAAIEKEFEVLAERLGTTVAKIREKFGGSATDAAVGNQSPEDVKKRLDKAFDVAIKAIEVDAKRRELILENARIKEQISEERYQEGLTAIKVRSLNAQLEVYRNFKRDQVNEALELQNQLAEIESGRALRNAAPVAALPTRQPGAVQSQNAGGVDLGPTLPTPEALRARFGALIDAELQYNILRAELQSAYYAEQLAMLEAAGKRETDEYQRIADRKKEADQSVADNKERLAEFERQLQETTNALFNDSINLAVQLLGKDEAARKKNASAIRSFQAAQVTVSGIAEVQKIWEKAAEFGPLQSIIAAVQTAAAIVRTTGAIARISSTKFASGGYTGTGFGTPDSSGYRQAGVVHEGEYVAPKWQVESAETGPVIRWLNARRLRGYADGGFVTVNTTPAQIPASPVRVDAALANIDMFISAVQQFNMTVQQFPREVRSRVVYTELEDTGAELNTVRDDAAL